MIYPVSAESGISWQDLNRMSVKHRSLATYRRQDYSWCFSAKMLQRVIGARVAMVAHARRIPRTLDELRALDNVAIAQLARCKSAHNRQAAEAARRVGGLAPYLGALAYRLVRLCEDSVQVATEMGVTPWSIRQTLYRMNKTAAQLADGTLRIPKPGSYRRSPVGPRARWRLKDAIPLRQAGMSYRELAAKFGVREQTMRSAFIKAGLIYPPARRPRPKLHKFDHHAALEMHRAGCSYTEIAARFGCHHTTVMWLVKKSPLAGKEKRAGSQGVLGDRPRLG